jgi:cellulose biosynthesis protein BcsQ
LRLVLELRLVPEVAHQVQQRVNPDLHLVGILFIRYNSNQRGKLNYTVVELARQFYGVDTVRPNIWRDIAVPLSQAHGQSLLAYNTDSNATHDYETLAHSLILRT